MTPFHLLNAIMIREDHHAKNTQKTAKLWKQFGREVRKQRREKKMSVKAFARRLKYTESMVNLLESGKRCWSKDKAHDAIHILNRSDKWPDV